MPKFQSLKGFRDFFPDDFATRAYITETWRKVAKSYGFQEYDAPPLESLDLYRHKSGDELVSQLYSFVDKGGREVALRPEMTPSVVRMVVDRWQSLPKPVRWFSIPQLFRYERPQAGRLREHFQFNVDVFGDQSYFAEADVLAVVIDSFKAFGLTSSDVKIRISDRRLLNRLLNDIGVAQSQVPLVYSVLDKFDRQERGFSADRLVGGGLSESVVDSLFDAIDKLRAASGRAALAEVVGQNDAFVSMIFHLHDVVDDANEWITYDLTIVRGLGYYTGTVFEAYDASGRYRAICGGGRYDSLVESLGGPSVAAVGMGWGDVVLTELLRELGKLPSSAPLLDFFVFSSADDPTKVRMFGAELRKLGLNVDARVGSRSRSQASNTSLRAARFGILISEGSVVITDAERGESYTRAGVGIQPLLNVIRAADPIRSGDSWIRAVRAFLDEQKSTTTDDR